MTKFELMEKRIDSAMTARNRCADGSWGDEYWAKVVAQLVRQLNQYVNDDKYLIHEYDSVN
tara:strand:- start:1586 stop:1768 length:183 start_codon:yes stop_codon:yes gene_type:complete